MAQSRMWESCRRSEIVNLKIGRTNKTAPIHSLGTRGEGVPRWCAGFDVSCVGPVGTIGPSDWGGAGGD